MQATKKAVPREEDRSVKVYSTVELVTTVASTAITTVSAAIATTATATTAAVTTTTAASATLFTGLGFVDLDVASVHVLTVKILDRGVHGSFGVHRHEGEATGASAFAIRREVNISHGSVFGEEGLEVLLCRIERQIANIHFHNRFAVSAWRRLRRLLPISGFQITTEFRKLTWQYFRP